MTAAGGSRGVGEVSRSLYARVPDGGAHHARAAAAGPKSSARRSNTDHGPREYSRRDPEGHVRSFGTYRPERGA